MREDPSFVFLDRATILAIHEEQLALHGGGLGVRDEGLLDSALLRPINRITYEHAADFAVLAADYAFGIARNHPFIDGNKRTAFVAMVLCMRLNGMQLNASDEDALLCMLELASGALTLDDLSEWIRDNAIPGQITE